MTNTNATYATSIAIDLPDYPAATVTFTNTAFFVSGNSEVLPGKQYTLTLNSTGQGTQTLPCPDNTGDAAVNWRINLPSKESGTYAIAYDAATQQLSDILAAQSTTADPDSITAALANRIPLVNPATAGNLVTQAADGTLADAGFTTDANAVSLLAELYAARQEASEGDILAIIDGVLTFIESGPAPITGYSFDFSEFSDGAIPSPISGATWAISGGKAINTPAAGSNLLLDPGLENWNSATDLTSWAETANGSSSVNRDDSEQRSGTYCARLDTDVSLSDCSIQQNVAGQPAGRFVRLSAWHKATGGQVRFSIATGAAALRVRALGAAYEKLVAVGITNGSSLVNQTRRWTGSQSQSIWVDDFVLELLTTSSVIFTLPETVANARVSAAWTIDQATIAGVVANVDDASNPQNFMLAYVRRDDGGNRIALLKCVAGTFSNVIAETAVTYVANAPIEIRKTGSTTYQLWYNGSQVGTDQTVSDAAIIDNKIHGALSTWEGNTLQSFFQSAIA